jgi:hypothetical protein
MKILKDKQGNKLTVKEFMSRWAEGIANLTPLQKVSNEARAALITLLGNIGCLIVLIIFREKFFVHWFAYALILIFIGNTWSTGIKVIGLHQQIKMFKGLDNSSRNLDEMFKGLKEVETKETEEELIRDKIIS